MNLKKTATNTLSLVLAATMLLSGCGSNTASTPTPSGDKPATSADASTGSSAAPTNNFDPNVNPKGVLPIVKEPITLTMAIQANPQVTDFQNNEFTKWVEEKTNIKLEIVVLPDKEKDRDTKINLMFAAGKDLPDILNTGYIANSTIYKYALDELIIPLDPYIKEYGVEYPAMIAENPGLDKACVAPDGNTYGLPKFNLTLHNQMKFGKMYLYKPWLDKLGLKMPETVDDLYNVLKAFKTQDPNENGKADEIPLAGAITGAGTKAYLPILAPFIPYDDLNLGLYNDNGKIIATYMEPEFKQGMEYMNKLISEKLLDPVSFTQDQEQLKQMANRKETTILGGYIHAYTAVNATDPKMLDYVCVPLLKSSSTRGGFLKDPLLPKGPSFVVTADCKYPEAAYRLGDFLLNAETCMINRYGIEDRDWKKVDPATTKLIGLDGEPARFEIINNVWSETGSTLWRSECLLYNNYENVYGKGFESGKFNPDLYHHENTMKYFKPYVVADIVPLNSLFFTKEEMSDYSLLSTSIKDQLEQQLAAFATGGRKMTEWESFQKEMQALGLDQYLKYVQDAYDRQFGTK